MTWWMQLIFVTSSSTCVQYVPMLVSVPLICPPNVKIELPAWSESSADAKVISCFWIWSNDPVSIFGILLSRANATWGLIPHEGGYQQTGEVQVWVREDIQVESICPTHFELDCLFGSCCRDASQGFPSLRKIDRKQRWQRDQCGVGGNIQALKAELKGVIQSCVLNQLKIIIKTKRKKNKDAKSLAVNVSCLF